MLAAFDSPEEAYSRSMNYQLLGLIFAVVGVIGSVLYLLVGVSLLQTLRQMRDRLQTRT